MIVSARICREICDPEGGEIVIQNLNEYRVSAPDRRLPARLRRLAQGCVLIGALAVFSMACASTGSREPVEFIFYPGAPEIPRIQYLTSISNERDIGASTGWIERFLFGERAPAPLMKPYGLDIRDGKIFVVDTIAAGVAVLDVANNKVETLGSRQPGRLKKPINIAVDEDGTRYVTDRQLERVMVYDAENRYVKAFGDPDEWAPTDVLIHGGDLYVADRENGQVIVLDKQSGEELHRLGSEGIGAAEFLFPTNLAIDDDSNLYVADTLN